MSSETYYLYFSVIYEPKKGDNEEKSAELFTEFAKEIAMPEEDRELVIYWILQTKQHCTAEHHHESEHYTDEHYFLDLDMSILGATSSSKSE